jgi:ribonuclease VapC
MVIDTSALVALLTAEPESDRFVIAIVNAQTRLLAGPSYLETAMVLLKTLGPLAVSRLDGVIAEMEIEVVAFTYEQARIAAAAFQQFGKGRHRAALNFGDCFTYALAKERDEPVLFKGDDFAATDLTPAGLI